MVGLGRQKDFHRWWWWPQTTTKRWEWTGHVKALSATCPKNLGPELFPSHFGGASLACQPISNNLTFNKMAQNHETLWSVPGSQKKMIHSKTPKKKTSLGPLYIFVHPKKGMSRRTGSPTLSRDFCTRLCMSCNLNAPGVNGGGWWRHVTYLHLYTRKTPNRFGFLPKPTGVFEWIMKVPKKDGAPLLKYVYIWMDDFSHCYIQGFGQPKNQKRI